MSPGSACHRSQTWRVWEQSGDPKYGIETLSCEAPCPRSGRSGVTLCTMVPGGGSTFVSQQDSAFKYLLCIFPVSAHVSLLCTHLVD